ncbi:unnamed protein product [Soboliphyme baturini]|uniref:Neuropeptide n=1 Tax=Soboliphyme baturini TaxID=241478 RepID=A0A183J3S3_9BILA|nr:unnamed protein product [Soboliphyme baturini]
MFSFRHNPENGPKMAILGGALWLASIVLVWLEACRSANANFVEEAPAGDVHSPFSNNVPRRKFYLLSAIIPEDDRGFLYPNKRIWSQGKNMWGKRDGGDASSLRDTLDDSNRLKKGGWGHGKNMWGKRFLSEGNLKSLLQ